MIENQRKGRRQTVAPRAGGGGSAILVLALCVLGYIVYQNYTLLNEPPERESVGTRVMPMTTISRTEAAEITPLIEVDPIPTETPIQDFSPYALPETEPSNFIHQVAVMVNGEVVEEYSEREQIDFLYGRDYTEMEGIITFRGNNFREGASYGTANLEERKFIKSWNVSTGALTAPDGVTWTGHGWTGQPLIVRWPESTKAIMNMYDWAKEKEGLVEVIYAGMDGNIYFIDLDSGAKTRDNLYMGYTFKGSGTLDPRGYPILYLGSGYNSSRGASRAFIVSLIDCKVMYEFGNGDGFALRTWPMFDGSALVDAETDQLIYPSENGVIYIIKLNTVFDEAAGTVSVEPSDVVKWRYSGKRTTWTTFWIGFEVSAVIWRGHIILADNGGNMMCIDLNTLEPVWVQDVLDDTNSSPVLELEDGHPYVYISTSFHAGWRAPEHMTATIPIWKIDAVTGEIVWQTDYKCYTVAGLSGGVEGTAALGKNKLSSLIYMPVARTPNGMGGKLVALDKRTGEEAWAFETSMYAWSSPVDVYDDDGNGYIIYCTTGGYMYLLDGLTGEVLDSRNLSSTLEASPAVFGNTVVMGTRTNGIFGVTMG